MTFDLRLNSNFDLVIDDRNDLATVEGRDQFEQEVVIYVTEYMYGVIGTTGEDTMRERLRLQVNRVADDHDLINRVADVKVTPSAEKANTFEVRIIYDQDEEDTVFEVSN